MGKYEPLVIGELNVKYPVIQGGMGIGISLSSLAGAVAKAGGIGLISTAQIGFREPDFNRNPKAANLRAMESELARARELAPDGVIGFNIMVATKDYPEYVRKAAEIGADVIVSGAGLPVSLPEYVEDVERQDGKQRKVKIAPIVSSPKSASVICKMWDRKYHRAPDFVVIEGPLAGGHLGFSREDLTKFRSDREDTDQVYDQEAYDNEILGILAVVENYRKKFGCSIPVISAGGVFSREDMAHHMALGVDGVQVGTRFVTTEECDAPQSYKDAYLKAQKKDIVIVKSPVGMPGRAIWNPFLEKISKEPERITHCFRCLEHCDPVKAPYCITMALIRAALGQVDEGLLFCGYNAHRCSKMERVEDVMADLCG
ncbi:MAG: nitronate monooxygenase family protein [Lachnospiraceae bacterium]|nr:nitronate monooxygenase family protein [Lachnospiraceae bacterium]